MIMYKFLLMPLLFGAVIGQNPQALWRVGEPAKAQRLLTADMLIEISDQLTHDDIAEVDLDPEAFDLSSDPKPRKKDVLDEIEFVSERD